MTATLRLNLHSTRPCVDLEGAPFPPVSTPARKNPDVAAPSSLFRAPANIIELELPTPKLLAIPELEAFDQEELNDNPVFNDMCPIPLIGALLLDRRLITREQLDASLIVQAQMHPAPPIGQILVRRGYISQDALDRTLGIQAEMRAALEETFQTQILPAALSPKMRQQH